MNSLASSTAYTFLLLGVGGIQCRDGIGRLAIELYHFQDLSGNLSLNTMNMATQLGEAVRRINETFKGPNKFGLGTFMDKPSPGRTNDMHCFWDRIPLGQADPSNIVKVLATAKTVNDFDKADALLDAMMYTLRGDRRIWGTPPNSDVVRVISVFSDGPYHTSGDSLLPPNDGSAMRGCENEDYPSEDQIDSVLAKSHATLIFSVPRKMVEYYEALAKRISTPLSVVELTNDSSNFSESLITEIGKVVCVTSQSTTQPTTGFLALGGFLDSTVQAFQATRTSTTLPPNDKSTPHTTRLKFLLPYTAETPRIPGFPSKERYTLILSLILAGSVFLTLALVGGACLAWALRHPKNSLGPPIQDLPNICVVQSARVFESPRLVRSSRDFRDESSHDGRRCLTAH